MSTQRSVFDRYARGEGYNPAPSTNLPQTNSYISGQTTLGSGQTSSNTPNYNPNSSSYSQNNLYQVQGRKEQRQADKSGYLKWASDLTNNVLISGSSDYTRLSNLRDAILELKTQYFHPNTGLSVKGPQGDELARRFLLIEHEVEGLLRRRIDISTQDVVSGNRDLDFTTVLTEKENTIIELQKQNQNLRERLRLANVANTDLQAKIGKLTKEVFELKGLKGGALDDAVQREQNYAKTQKELATLRQTFASTIGIWQSQIQNYKSKFPNANWDLDLQVAKYIQEFNIQPIQVNGYSVVELPSKSRRWLREADYSEDLNLLIRKSFVQILQNYPNIKTSIDPRIITFITNTSSSSSLVSGYVGQSNIDATVDVLDEVSLNRLIQIVKYVPETVRVQNVYAYSSSKSKRIEFHLRVLIKALLEEIEKLKIKFGAVLEIDQGVIGLINQEILDIVSVDDILKTFRVKERIVEVDRIVEKVVERIVEVPQIVPIEKYVQKIVEVPKYVEVQKIIHKPVEIVKVVDNIIEKFIEVPTIEEKIVEVPTEREVVVTIQKLVPKIIQVEKIVKQTVVDTKYIEIEKPVNHIITETQVLQVVKEVPIISQTVREVIKTVEILVEKIVPVEVVRVEVVEVEKIVEKIIKEIQYVPVTNEQLVLQERLVEVPVYIEKLVPVETIVNKIVNVPQRIEVPVIVKEYVPEIRTVQVFVEKVVEKVVPREIQKIKNVVVEKVVERIKTVDRKIEVPFLQDRIVTVTIEVPKIVIERIHVPHVVPVKCIEEKIIEKPKIVEVEKPYIQYIKDIQVVNCVVEKIVEVPRTIERIKEVKVRVEKIVNKLVQVPKVVEVEKVVEKVIVVPRVIEKIVEVPQLIEVIVEKIVEVPVVKTVEKVVEKIVYVEKPVEVEKIRNVYLEVDRPVEKIKEVPVVAETVIQKKEVIQIPVEKLVTLNKEVPVQILVDNVVERVVECVKLVEVQKQELVVIEVPQIVDRYIEKPVEIRQTVVEHKEIHIPVEVPVRQEIVKTKIVEVEKVVEKAVAINQPTIYTQTKVVVNQKFTPVIQEVKVPVKLPAEKPYVAPVVVDRFIEKPVEVLVEVRQDRAVHVENNVPVEVYRVVELNNDRCLIGTEHKIIREISDKIVPVHTYEQYAVQKECQVEKIVTIQKVVTKVQPQVQVVEKVVERENFKTYTDKVPYYEQKVQLVDRFETTQVPAFTTHEKIVTVPEFQEKIFERIIVMPQIVEVVKYVTEIVESENPLIAGLHVDILEQEKRYRELYGVSRKQLQILLVELRKLKTSQPALGGQIELVERYLLDFDRLAGVQKIVPVQRERIVQREVPKAVLVGKEDSESVRNQLAYSLLLEKLILQLKRIKQENSGVQLRLDSDVSLFFFNELSNAGSGSAGNFQESLSKYTREALGKLDSLGGNWAHSHELMLSTILAERFAMANLVKQANIEIERVQAISNANANAIKNLQNKWLPTQKLINDKRDALNRLLNNNNTLRGYPELAAIAQDFDRIASGSAISFEPLKIIESAFTVGTGTNWNRAVSRINELDLANKTLTERLVQAQKKSLSKSSVDTTSQFAIAALKSQNERLASQIDSLKKSASRGESRQSLGGSQNLEHQAKLRTANSRIQELELLLKTANSRIADLQTKLRTYTSRVQTLESELKEAKQVRSSAASETNLLASSNYSSSSSNVNLARTTYEVPSYASSSVYSVEPSGVTELSSSGVRQASTLNYTSGNTYGTAGMSAYQAPSKLTNSGFQSSNIESSNAYTYGSTNVTKNTTGNITSGGSSASSATFGATGNTYATGATGNTYASGANSSYGTGATFGTSPQSNEYGANRFNITTAATSPSYGTTGISSQYAGNQAATSGSVSGSFSSASNSLSGSGLRQSGTGFSSSNYTFQTKKF